LYAPRSFLNLCQDNRYVFPIWSQINYSCCLIV
jgi:hypothetical protein